MRKNGFLAFCFAFIPGGGQMYLGMMKKGLLLMGLFSAISFAMMTLYLDFLGCLLPVIWFYSFFDTLNSRCLSPEQIREIDDNTTQFFNDLAPNFSIQWDKFGAKFHRYFGIGLILFGLYLIFRNIFHPMLRFLFERLGIDYWGLTQIVRALPSLVISIAIIALGIHLVKGGRKPEQQDFVEYKGE